MTKNFRQDLELANMFGLIKFGDIPHVYAIPFARGAVLDL